MGLFAWLESRWAADRGVAARKELEQRFPDGIEVTVGRPFMVRLKVRNSTKNYVAWRCDKVPWLWRWEWMRKLANVELLSWCEAQYILKHPAIMRALNIYEVVFQARTYPDYGFVLSLFPDQLNLSLKRICITKYGVVRHFLHRLLIGHDTEVYPQMWTEVVK